MPGVDALSWAWRAVWGLLMPTSDPRGPWMVEDRGSPERYAAESSLSIHDDDTVGFVLVVLKRDADGTSDMIVRSQTRPEDREAFRRAMAVTRSS